MSHPHRDRAADAATLAAGQQNLTEWMITSPDGVAVRAWSNQGRSKANPDALAVIVCAGLGTPPEAWPLLLSRPEEFRVFGTYYRGTQGAPHPAGALPSVADHVADLIALMDSEGIGQAVFAGWSFGVNIACEAAARHPDRVRAVLGVAGVAGNTFDALFGPLPLPKLLRRTAGRVGSRVFSSAGSGIGLLAGSLPVPKTEWAFRHLGFALPAASPVYFGAVLGYLMQHEFNWFFKLAAGSGASTFDDVESITQPVTLISGKWDVLTAASAVAAAAKRIPDCRYRELSATHFLPTEYPEICQEELEMLAARVPG